MRVFVAGATGLVGRAVLAQALADDRIGTVVAPTRRPLEPRERLLNPTWAAMEDPVNGEHWSVDAAICALGTTRRAAGSAAAFRAVDHDLVLGIASRLRAAGARSFGVVSSAGANARSPFLYPRTKGEVEEALRLLGFASLSIVRPGVLDGARSESRPVERATLTILRMLGSVLPAAARASPVAVVATLLLEAAVSGAPGERIIGPAEIARARS